MSRIRALIFAISALCQPLCAQTIDAESAKSHVIVKYSPLPMWDFDNTVQFGVEVPLGPGNFTLQEDLGYGSSSFNLWYEDETDYAAKETFKSRTQFRYFYLEKRRMRAYVGPEVLLKKVIYRDNQWVGRDCADGFGNCNFFENKDVRFDKNVIAGHIRTGWQLYFRNRMTLDFFCGLGFRSIVVTSPTPEIGTTNFRSMRDPFQSIRPGMRDFNPSLTLGVHVGIVLGRFRKE